MTSDIDQLVHFTGEGPHMAEVKAAERIVVFPEVVQKLEEAYQLHQKPLEIKASDEPEYCGYETVDHSVLYKPSIVKRQLVIDDVGGQHPFSLERFLAHEIVHAGQAALSQEQPAYHARVRELLLQHLQEYWAEHMPVTEYAHSMVAAGDDATLLKQQYSRLYDEAIGPKLNDILNSFEQRMAQDAALEAHIQRYERPAVDFENHIAQKLGEKTRSSNYHKLDPDDRALITDRLFERETCIGRMVANHQKAVWEKLQTDLETQRASLSL